MKKVISLLLACVMLCGCVFALASCGKKLSGDYVLDATVEVVGVKSGAVTTYSFSGSKVTLSVDTYVANNKSSVSYEGKYEIAEASDGSLEITFTFENDKGEEVKEYSTTQVLKEAEDGKSITIGLLTFKKVEN